MICIEQAGNDPTFPEDERLPIHNLGPLAWTHRNPIANQLGPGASSTVAVGYGVPVTAVAAQLGHSKKSMSLDTYSHVLIDERR